MAVNARKYYAKFPCGHSAYIKYFGRTDLTKKLKKIEEGELCPDCKRKEFIKTAVRVDVPYSEYKEHYQNKRGIVTGEYNKKSHCITLYMTPKLSAQYKEKHDKVFYDAENIGVDENGNQKLAVFIKGNSFRLKDELKKLGYSFVNKRWQKEIIVFPSVYDKEGHKQLIPRDNPEFYTILKELESLGCINNMVTLKW